MDEAQVEPTTEEMNSESLSTYKGKEQDFKSLKSIT